jgi:large subunit ribosomal protein L32
MAHPKHRFSKQRTAKRRNSKKLETKPIYIDATSGEATLYHRVCLESGMYRGRQVMEAKEG